MAVPRSIASRASRMRDNAIADVIGVGHDASHRLIAGVIRAATATASLSSTGRSLSRAVSITGSSIRLGQLTIRPAQRGEAVDTDRVLLALIDFKPLFFFGFS